MTCPGCGRPVEPSIVSGRDIPWPSVPDADGRRWHDQCAGVVLALWKNAAEQLRLRPPRLELVRREARR